jgi:hypothetical protein
MVEEHVSSGWLAQGGVAGMLAVLLGATVLVLGIVVSARRGPRRHALALFAAAWLPLPIALFGKALNEIAAFDEIIRLGPAMTPKDMAAGLSAAQAVTACALLALLLGLSGAVAALARSQEDAPLAA